MDSLNFDMDKYLTENSKSLKDYILLIRTNLFSFIFISLVIIAAAVTYAVYAEDIYKSTVTLRITKQKQNILESAVPPEENGLINDRFIANEIEVINNYDTREKEAKALIDSFNNSKEKNLFKVLKMQEDKGINRHKSLKDIAEILKYIVSAEQISGLDVVEISAESPSPYEATLIANTCAIQYKELNLESNRNQLTTIREFFEKQSKEKLNELNNAEDILKNFQKSGGIVALDAQSTALINHLAQLEAQRDAARIDLMTSSEVLNQYKNEVKKQDPQLVEYLESQTSQAYIDVLQKQIAELQMNRDFAMTNKNPNIDVSPKVKDYDKKITQLKEKLSALINDIKVGAFASSPDQIKDLIQKLIEEEINNNSLSIKLKELQTIINKYEKDFSLLPETSIELAQYQRKRESHQQLYLLIEKKYQEAMINELSQPGNAVIIGIGRVPYGPAKPNRILIVLIGLIAGLGTAFGYLLIKDYFDDTVKTPEDIHKKNISVLAWVPHLKNIRKNSSGEHELIVMEKPDSVSSESFRSIRARIQFSRIDSNSIKTILITSPAEQEGKTVVSINLAGSYAQSGKRTLLIDCDLRRPRVHSLMKAKKTPGLVDYLFNKVKLDEIIRNSKINDLSYVTSGTIPPDPAEVLESKAMKNFLEEMKYKFDVVIIDSAPIVAVIDSEILSRLVDGTILVISADRTEIELMTDAVELIKSDKGAFLGTVLNNFRYKNGYGYYYKYYYSYSSSNGKGNKNHRVKA